MIRPGRTDAAGGFRGESPMLQATAQSLAELGFFQILRLEDEVKT